MSFSFTTIIKITSSRSEEGTADGLDENPAGDTNKSESDREMLKLKLECAKYKALCEAAKMEGDRLSHLIANQDKK